MPELSDFMLERGLSDEDLASLLTEKLDRHDRPITAHGVRAMRARQDKFLAKSWREALDLPEYIAAAEPAADPDEQTIQQAPAPGVSPPPPSGLPAPVALPFDGLAAKERIEMAYVGIGIGAARAMRNPSVELVFRQHAPGLAEKWIAAARQNARVAQLVTYVTAGGATGDLILSHVMLAVSLLVISGKVPIGGIPGLGPDVVVPKDDGRRPAREPEPQPEEGADGDGSEAAGAVRAVDDASAPPPL